MKNPIVQCQLCFVRGSFCKEKLLLSCWNSFIWYSKIMKIKIFELGNFSFNLYIYYLPRGFIASTRAFNLLIRAFNLSARAFNLTVRTFSLLTRGFELVTCGFDFVTSGFAFVTCGFELAPHVLLFHYFLKSNTWKHINPLMIGV